MSIPTVSDIKCIEVSEDCETAWPCGHFCTVVLNDGRHESGFDSFEIWGLVSAVAKEKINPKSKNSSWVTKHFKEYSKPYKDWGWEVKTADQVLAKHFSS